MLKDIRLFQKKNDLFISWTFSLREVIRLSIALLYEKLFNRARYRTNGRDTIVALCIRFVCDVISLSLFLSMFSCDDRTGLLQRRFLLQGVSGSMTRVRSAGRLGNPANDRRRHYFGILSGSGTKRTIPSSCLDGFVSHFEKGIFDGDTPIHFSYQR